MNIGLVEMMRYNAWANSTLFDACRELTDEQLGARLPVTSGSTRELLIHIVGGQQTFALRTQGRQHEGEVNRSSAIHLYQAPARAQHVVRLPHFTARRRSG